MKKNFMVLAMLSFMAVLISGCETLNFSDDDLEKGVHHRVSFHEIVKYPRASKLERSFRVDGSEDEVWVNVNFFLDTKNIPEIEMVERPDENGVYDIEMELDEIGTLRWMNLSTAFYGEKVAMVVDGTIFKLLEIKTRGDEKTKRVRLEGPFEFVKGKLVEKYAKHNYAFYH